MSRRYSISLPSDDNSDREQGCGATSSPNAVKTWKILRSNSAYRRIYAAQIVSQGGDWFTMIPLIVLLQDLTGSGALGAFLLGAETLVIAVLSPTAGLVSDRRERRRILVTAQVLSAFALLPLLAIHDATTAWLGVLTYSLLAVGKAFFAPAAGATVPQVVKPEELLTASTSLSSLWGVMLALGASLGGLAAALTSPQVCFIVTMCGYAGSAWLLRGLPRLAPAVPAVPSAEHQTKRGLPRRLWNLASDTGEVARMCLHDSRLSVLLASKPCTHLGNGAIALFPALVATMDWQGHRAQIAASLLYAARGIGALIGPIAGRTLVGRRGRLRGPLITAMILFALGYGALALTNSVVLALITVTIAHVGGSMNAGLSGYGLQHYSSDDVRGRVLAFDNMIATIAIATSQLGVATALTFWPPHTVLLLCVGVVAGTSTGWYLLARLRGLA